MFLSEHKLTFEEWKEKNSHLINENNSEKDLYDMYEDYLKDFN